VSDDDDDLESTMYQAFGSLINFTQDYKKQQDALKNGQPSTISEVFGFAADLLPEEHRKRYERGRQGWQLGDDLFGEHGNAAAFHTAVQELLQEHAGGDDIGVGATIVDESGAELEVVGVIYSGDQKMLELSDGTIIESPEMSLRSEPSPADEAVEQLRSLTTAIQDPLEEIESEVNQEAPVLVVYDKAGRWLWDIHFVDAVVSRVVMSNTTIIERLDNEYYTVTAPGQVGQIEPEVEEAAVVFCDHRTGNIFYINSAETHSVVWLNNGWRAEQYNLSDGEQEFFVTSPPDQSSLTGQRTQVCNLQIHPHNGEVSYESMDEQMAITLKSRML